MKKTKEKNKKFLMGNAVFNVAARETIEGDKWVMIDTANMMQPRHARQLAKLLVKAADWLEAKEAKVNS